MSRTFREWNPDQSWLFPPSPQDWLPDGHLVYFLMDVSEQLDLSPIMEKYDSEKGGKPPYHPRMMLVLLLHSYCIGVFSSRKIVARCETDVAFRVIVGDNIPDFRTISEYRRRHLEQFQHLFVEVLRLCRESGLLKVGRLALDGTKIKANASRHKAMSYDRMLAEEKRLQAEIDELLKQAQAADDAEDAELGRDHRGDELPDELRRRESRLLKIREAKAALEQQARDKAAAEAAIREAEGKPPAKTDPQDAVPDPKAQRNFTDPESKIMKTSSKGWDQCGNAQAVVNENQIIVAAARMTLPMALLPVAVAVTTLLVSSQYRMVPTVKATFVSLLKSRTPSTISEPSSPMASVRVTTPTRSPCTTTSPTATAAAAVKSIVSPSRTNVACGISFQFLSKV